MAYMDIIKAVKEEVLCVVSYVLRQYYGQRSCTKEGWIDEKYRFRLMNA